VLASILREERAARDAARAEAAQLQLKLDVSLARNAEWEESFREQGGQDLVWRCRLTVSNPP
jgi:hypothetical protein